MRKSYSLSFQGGTSSSFCTFNGSGFVRSFIDALWEESVLGTMGALDVRFFGDSIYQRCREGCPGFISGDGWECLCTMAESSAGECLDNPGGSIQSAQFRYYIFVYKETAGDRVT